MTSRALQIRRARSHDLPEAAALYERVATATLYWAPREEYAAARFLDQARYETIWLAWAGRRIVGLAAMYEPTGFLHSLYVDDGWRNKGVGVALLETAAGAANGALSLKVEERNEAARRFYKREGFSEVERGVSAGSIWIRLSRA